MEEQLGLPKSLIMSTIFNDYKIIASNILYTLLTNALLTDVAQYACLFCRL